METSSKFFLLINLNMFLIFWLFLALVGRFLLMFRNDYHRISEDWKSIKSSGFFRVTSFYIACLLLLPFSIPYSIKNIRNQNK